MRFARPEGVVTEDVMARIRIAALGVSCLLVLAATLGSAEAQTAGSPLPLLQIDHPKTAVHARHKPAVRIARTKSSEKITGRHVARRIHTKTRVAEAARDLPTPPTPSSQTISPQAASPQATPPQTTSQNDFQNIWPAPAAAADTIAAPSGGALPGGVTPVAPTAASAPSVVTESVVDTDPNGILNGGHDVPTAMPNPIKPAVSTPKPQPVVAQPAATSPSPPPVKVAAAAPVLAKPAVRAMLFKPSSPSPIGSASWIAQMLAALGGAIAAGAVAWFLIRPASEQNYG